MHTAVLCDLNIVKWRCDTSCSYSLLALAHLRPARACMLHVDVGYTCERVVVLCVYYYYYYYHHLIYVSWFIYLRYR